MRSPGRRWWIVAAALAIGAAATWWWWEFERPRVLTVSIFPDYAYRQRAEWKKTLETRMQEVSRIYQPQTGVRWKVASIETEDPINGMSAGFDARRLELSRNRTYPADVLLIVTGVHEGPRTGAVSPFSHAALVVDFPEATERQNTLNTAHELAHLFAAPHEPGTSTLMAPEPHDGRFSQRASTLIHRLRRYDFRQGTAGLQGAWDRQVFQAEREALTGLFPNPVSQAHEAMAAALSLEAQYDPAIRHMREAVKADPGNASMRVALALVLVQNTQSDEAIAALREGIRAIPQNSQLHSLLASILARGDREEALDEYQTAIRLAPDRPDLYEAVGMLLLAGNARLDAAIGAFQEALRLNPASTRARAGLARAQSVKGQAAAEAARLRRVAEANRTDWNAYYKLGQAEGAAGDYDAAQKAFSRALELNPQAGQVHTSMALAYYIRGNYGAASAELEKAKALGMQPPRDFLAALQRRRGK